MTRAVSFGLALPTVWLASTPAWAAALPRTGRAADWLDFSFMLPSAAETISVAVFTLLLIVVLFSLYRLRLRQVVQHGVHPHTLSTSLWLLGVGGVLIILFFFMPGVGIGYFVTALPIIMVVSAILVAIQRVLAAWALSLFVVLVAIALLKFLGII